MLKQAQREVQEAQSSTDGAPSLAGTQAAYARHRRALDEFAANEAGFAENLRASLTGLAGDAVTLLTLCRQWTMIVSIPPSFPRPVDLRVSGLRAGVAQHLDRAHAVHVLLGLDVPFERLRPGVAALAERTPAARAAADAYRNAVLAAIEASDLLTVESPLHNHDWTKMKPARERQTQAALEARERRMALLTELTALHEAVAAALDDEAATLYRRAIQRIAYPSAVQGIDQAMLAFERALALDDLTPDQRGRITTIAAETRASLFDSADDIASHIDAFISADGFTDEAKTRAAGAYARMEHAMFVRDERCAAVRSLLRPILTPAQMTAVSPARP
jgi:hypothetical protein